MKTINSPTIGKKAVGSFFLFLFILIVLFSAVYTVQAGERKIVKRFGKAVSVSGEGIHLKVPFVDSLETVDIRTHKIENNETTAGTSDLQNITTSVLPQAYRLTIIMRLMIKVC